MDHAVDMRDHDVEIRIIVLDASRRLGLYLICIARPRVRRTNTPRRPQRTIGTNMAEQVISSCVRLNRGGV